MPTSTSKTKAPPKAKAVMEAFAKPSWPLQRTLQRRLPIIMPMYDHDSSLVPRHNAAPYVTTCPLTRLLYVEPKEGDPPLTSFKRTVKKSERPIPRTSQGEGKSSAGGASQQSEGGQGAGGGEGGVEANGVEGPSASDSTATPCSPSSPQVPGSSTNTNQSPQLPSFTTARPLKPSLAAVNEPSKEDPQNQRPSPTPSSSAASATAGPPQTSTSSTTSTLSQSTRVSKPISPASEKTDASRAGPSRIQKSILANALLKVSSSAPEMSLTKKSVPIHERAVHALFLLELLRSLEKKQVSKINGEGTVQKVPLSSMTTWEIVEHFVIPETKGDSCSVIESLANGGISSLSDWCSDGRFTEDIEVQGQSGQMVFGPVTYYVSHCYSYRFKDLVSLVQQHYKTLPGQQAGFFPCYYWLDFLAVGQNDNGWGATSKSNADDFLSVISRSSSLLFTIHPLLKPVSPSRAWCLFEMMVAHLDEPKGVTLEILVADDTDRTNVDPSKSFADAYLELLKRFKVKAIEKLDICTAATSVEADKAMILSEIDAGFEGKGISKFNELAKQLLQSRMKEALLRHALRLGDATGAQCLIDHGAEFCSGCCFISGLKSSGNATALVLALALSTNKTLKQLVIRRSNVQGAGAAALASSLRSHPRIEELDLNDNPEVGMGEEGAAAIASLVHKSGTLTTLSLANTGLVDSSLMALGDALEREGEAKGSTCPLKFLNLSGNKAVTNLGLEPLFRSFSSPLCTLTRLSLSNLPNLGSAASPLGFSVGSCPSLTHLILSNCKLSAADITSLAPGLVKSQLLSHLDLQENEIEGEQIGDALARIVKGCKSLSELLLDGNSNLMTKVSAAALSNSFHSALCLRKLGLSMTGMTSAAAKVLAPSISSMVASMGGAKTFCPLVDLDLSGNEVGDSGASFIFSALKAHRTLERLNMNSMNLTKQCASSILALIGDVATPTGSKGSGKQSANKGGVPLCFLSISGNDESLDETVYKVNAWQAKLHG